MLSRSDLCFQLNVLSPEVTEAHQHVYLAQALCKKIIIHIKESCQGADMGQLYGLNTCRVDRLRKSATDQKNIFIL